MTTATQILEELQALGTERTRRTYRRHGVAGEIYGVSYGDLAKLRKRIETDHDLARALWATGNHDARILATTIADPRRADDALLDAWARDLGDYVVADAFSDYVAKTPLARGRVEQWTRSPGEWVGTAGWNLLAHLAMRDKTLPDEYFAPYLAHIEREIHGGANRVRYAMNNALIAIGLRNDNLERAALAAAGKIGTVVVDHGETNCKTPDASSSIEKAGARRQRATGQPDRVAG
jgi:3-methyladenine DNA glycosylase AlkD